MFNKLRLKQVLAEYKKVFVQQQWPNEKYKWEAVQCFQNNWDINSPDFAQMLKKSLDQVGNLLASANNFPAKMIISFAEAAPEEVRSMYMELYDESKDLCERIANFKDKSNHCWSVIQMELHSTISMKMQSWHICGCAIQTNIISINSVK